MSPEQVTGRMELDARTDIYSLGIVLYELLVLRQPITATNRDGVLRNIVIKPLRPVSKLNPKVPEQLENVVHKATAKDPDGRYGNARQFSDDLMRYLEGKEVQAPRYRYRVDLAELRAQLPFVVIVCAFVQFNFAMLCLTLLAAVIFTVETRLDSHVKPGALIMYGCLLIAVASSVQLCIGLLRAKPWSRFQQLVHNSLMSTLFVVGPTYYDVWRTTYFESQAFAAWWFLWRFFGPVFLIGLALAPFVNTTSRDWFALARRLRMEAAVDMQ